MKSYIFQFLIGTNNFIKVKDEKLYHLSTYYSSHFHIQKARKYSPRYAVQNFVKIKVMQIVKGLRKTKIKNTKRFKNNDLDLMWGLLSTFPKLL